ncbi:MAG: 6-phosphogluconolactonase [Verrucomicrobiae bacterium]|nr:6-phosphogluconolactonase [Verrucomicrobiae bacterium]
MKPGDALPPNPDVWIIACRDDRHAASEAARTLLDAFVLDGERDFALALSGGRIAPILGSELARQAELRNTPFAEADFFWADERCVRPDHPESNYRVAKTSLLDRLAVAPARIHRLLGELPPDQAVIRANADWAQWAERRGPQREVLDCVLLGVGEDGHVASLFPDNLPSDLVSTLPFHSVVGPKPPPQRLTLGYPMLWNARRVIVLATGDGKAAVVRDSLAGRLESPLARVLHGRIGKPTVVITHAPPATHRP